MNSVPLLERERFWTPVTVSNERHFQTGKSFKTRGKTHTQGGRGKYLEGEKKKKKERCEGQIVNKREHR